MRGLGVMIWDLRFGWLWVEEGLVRRAKAAFPAFSKLDLVFSSAYLGESVEQMPNSLREPGVPVQTTRRASEGPEAV